MFDIRLRYYSSPTAKGRILPALNIDYTSALNTSPTLRFTLSERAAGYLSQPFLLAVETRSPSGVWSEPPNARMIVRQDDADDADEAKIVRYIGVGFIPWLMNKCHLGWSSSAKDGGRTWTDRPPGWILNTFLTEAKNRGWAPFVTWGFSGTLDSNGNAWAESTETTVTHALLTKTMAVLEAMANSGLCDWYTQGNVLHMVPAGAGVDRTTGDGAVALGYKADARRGRSDFDEVFTDLTVVPEKSRNWLYLENEGAPSQFGRLEESLTLDGVGKATTATRLAQPTLQAGRSSRREYTVTYLAATATQVPIYDFQIGDAVKVKTREGWQNLRVVEFTLSRNDEGVVTITIAFEYRFRSLTSRLAGRVGRSGTGRFVGGGAGRPIPSAPPLANPEPKAPGGLAVTVNAGGYDEDGLPITNVTIDWDPVGQAIDDSEIDVELYEVWLGESGGARRRLTGTTDAELDLVLKCDIEIQIEIRARSLSGLWSEFSDILTFTTNRATTPLAAPTIPILYSSPGAVLVEWDGLLSDGAPPPQFRYIYASYSLDEFGTYENAGAPFEQNGTTITGLPGGATVYVKTYAVDSNGLVSAASPTASVVVTPRPAVPTGFAVASNVGGWNAQGIPNATVTLEWEAVTEAVNGDDVAIGLYELWLALDPAEPEQWRVTSELATVLDLPVGGDYTARLRAQSTTGLWSEFTDDLTFSTAADTTPMSAPSSPTLDSRLGSVAVLWDGELVDGAPPARFRRVFAAISDAEAGTYTPAGPSFSSGGTVLAGLAVGSTVWVRLYAVDSSGILSTGSDPVSIVVEGVGPSEILPGAVGPEALAVGSVTTLALAANSVTAQAMAVGAVTADAVSAGIINTYHLAANVGAELDLSSNEGINLLVGQISDVQGQTDENGEALEALATYYSFGPDGAVISSPGSEYELTLSSDGISINESGVEVSRWEAGQMQVARIVVNEGVFGNHKIERFGDRTVVREL